MGWRRAIHYGHAISFYQNLPELIKKQLLESTTWVETIGKLIECVIYLRNMIAHYMRIYNFKTQNAHKM